MRNKLFMIAIITLLMGTIISLYGCGDLQFPWNPGSEEIYIMDIESGKETFLAKNSVKHPRFSPQGNNILYIIGYGTNNEGIYTINIDGTDNKNIINEYTNYAEWSPDGSKIVYIYDGELYIINTDGTNKTLLVTMESNIDRPPTWSSNGKEIVIYCDNEKIYVYSIDRGTIEVEIAYNADPLFSVLGEKVNFATRDGIYISNLDGTNKTKIADYGLQPRWSPSGAKIMFVSGEAFWIMNNDGTNKNMIVDVGAKGISWPFLWLADETKIIYPSYGVGGSSGGLYLVNIMEKTEKYLTGGEDPSMSPDGKTIVYLRRID